MAQEAEQLDQDEISKAASALNLAANQGVDQKAVDFARAKFENPDLNDPGLITSIKSGVGQQATAIGRTLQDVPLIGGLGPVKRMKEWGERVQKNNPQAIQHLSDVVENPLETIKEGAGNAVAQMPATVGGGFGGRVLGGIIGSRFGPGGVRIGQKIGAWLGMGVPTLAQEYGGIREQQDQAVENGNPEADDKLRALAGAIPATAVEFGMGPQRILGKVIGEGVEGLGAKELAKQFAKETAGMTPGQASRHVLASGAKQLGRQGLEEGAEELVQNPLEAWGAHQDPTSPESIDQALTGAALGFAGGLTLGAPLTTVQHVKAKGMLDRGEVAPAAEPAPPPSGPLGAAAAAGQAAMPPAPAVEEPPIDPLAERLNAMAPTIENRDLISQMRRDPRFGPETVTDALHAWSIAKNPNLDQQVRSRALDSLQTLYGPDNFAFGKKDTDGAIDGEAQRVPGDPQQGQLAGPPAFPALPAPSLMDDASKASVPSMQADGEPSNTEQTASGLPDAEYERLFDEAAAEHLAAQSAPAVVPPAVDTAAQQAAAELEAKVAAARADAERTAARNLVRDRVDHGFTSLNGSELTNPKTGEIHKLNNPAEILVAQDALRKRLDTAAHAAATSDQNDLAQPTEAQKAAGNYTKAHINWNGLDLAIENPKGSQRSGTDPNGQAWSVTMPAHYGYVKKTMGADGDQVDLYLGNTPHSQKVFVVDQIDAATGKFDEHKAIGNVRNLSEAEALYDAGFSDGKGPQRRGAITEMSVDQFKDWVKSGDTTKPLAYTGKPPAAAPTKPISQWTADELKARLDRGGLSPESEQTLRAELAKRPAATKTTTSPAAKVQGLTIGKTPQTAEPVTVRNGVVFIGNEPAIDYETEADVTVPEGATPQQIVDALRNGGVLGSRKVFGLNSANAQKAESTPPPSPVAGDAQLAPAKVYYRDDNGVLWGIPYEMRDGQQPKDIKPEFRQDWQRLSGANFSGNAALSTVEADADGARLGNGEWDTVESIRNNQKPDQTTTNSPENTNGPEAAQAVQAEEERPQEPAAEVSDAERQAANRAALAAKAKGVQPELIGTEDAGLKRLQETTVRFASGMSAISDLAAGAYARGGHQNSGIGVDVGLLSKNAIETLANAIVNQKVKVFIDSGAFSNFRKGLKNDGIEPLDFDAILAKYDAIERAISDLNAAEEDYPRPMLVMPDVVGDQAASLAMVEKYKPWIAAETQFNVSTPIVPIQKGAFTLEQAYQQIVTTLGTDHFVVGLPSNAEAISREELAAFLGAVKPARVHFLGAASSVKLDPLLAIVAHQSPDTEVTADASQIRNTILTNVKKGMSRNAAIIAALHDKSDPLVASFYDDESTPATGAALPNATAPEHVQTGVDDRELGQIVEEFNAFQAAMIGDGDEKITHVFDAPAKGEVVRLADKVKVYHKDHGWMTPAQAKAKIEEWKEHTRAQYDNPETRTANSQRVVLSLFDLSGKWSQPWEEAGYQVYRFDIQNDPVVGDVNNFSTEFFSDWFGDFDGMDIYAILAATPCTDFASSGARHFAAKDADGRTIASVKLVHQTLKTIEYFKPAVWALENPVGRIESLGGLPPWRLSFDPNHVGEDYTKKTLIWGRFDGNLPIAPTEATEGSKMHRLYGGKSMATKNARSETPEGFAYSFFMANNAVDHPAMAIANKFDRLDRGLIAKAVDAGVTADQIESAVEDFYYMDLDDEAANRAVQELIDEATPPEGSKDQAPEERPAFELTAEKWDAMGYGERQDIASASNIGGMRNVVHRISGSRWDELSAGERNTVTESYSNRQSQSTDLDAKPLAEQSETAVPEPKGWRSSYGTARKYAEALGIDLRGQDGKMLKLPQLVEAIDANLSAGINSVVKESLTVGTAWRDKLLDAIRADDRSMAVITGINRGVNRADVVIDTWAQDKFEPKVADLLLANKISPEEANAAMAALKDKSVLGAIVNQLATEQAASIAGVEPKTDTTPETAEQKKAKLPQREGREAQRSIFRSLTADPAMLGKSVDEIRSMVNDKIADAQVSPADADKLASAIHRQLQKQSKEIEKQKHRDPAVYAGALDAAKTRLGVEANDIAKSAAFGAGFEHAMKGRTKSTLAGDELASLVLGYEAAQEWIKSEEGAAWYEGRPVNKLENTGLDLRRWYEQMRQQMKAGESDIKKAWKQIEKATARADLFAPLIPDGVTPGYRLYVEQIRGVVKPFKKWLESHSFYGSTAWKSSDKSNLDFILEGSRYPGSLSSEDRTRWTGEEQFRINWLQDKADEYLRSVRAVVERFSGTSSVKEAAEKFNADYIAEDDESPYHVKLSEAGNKFRYSDLFDGKSSDFTVLRLQSLKTQALIEKETSIELPNRAQALTPPKLDRVTRDGPAVRGDWNAVPKDVKAEFGFADIGFGTWVGAKQDQDHLNYANDAFTDLAKHFGFDKKHIGFGGRLHLTIGALGRGKAAAHFQKANPSPIGPVPVINLTNTKGDGTVYHEWIHALDHFLGGQWNEGYSTVRGKLLSYLKNGVMSPEQVENRARDFLYNGWYWKNDKRMDKVEAAVRGMGNWKAMANGHSAYKRNADALGKDYWGNDHELIARAAEAWAVDTLGFTDTYLVNAAWSGDGAVTKEKGYRGTPYPSGQERQLFNKIFTALAKSVTWGEDGLPSVTLADFMANLPPEIHAGEERRKQLQNKSEMQIFKENEDMKRADAERAKREEAAQKSRDEQDALDAAAEAALAAMSPPIVDTPPASETMGPLSDDDISAIFDEAAAELREEGNEQPDVPPPGDTIAPENHVDQSAPDKLYGQPDAADAKSLRDMVEAGRMVVFSGSDYADQNGLPTIHNISSTEYVGAGATNHIGFGVIQFRGVDKAGQPLKMTWSAGGAMSQTAGGVSYSTVSVDEGNISYPKDKVLSALDAIATPKSNEIDARVAAILDAGYNGLKDQAARLGEAEFALKWRDAYTDAALMLEHQTPAVPLKEVESIYNRALDTDFVMDQARRYQSQFSGKAPATTAKPKVKEQPAPAPSAASNDVVDKTAGHLIAEAAKLGVKGVDEALKGLSKLFGGTPGRLNSFPAGFDEETYKAAKPHFQAALKAFQEAGKTLKDLFKLLIQTFGDGVKPYAVQFAKDNALTANLGAAPSASSQVADQVVERLASGTAFDWRELFAMADAAYGGTQGEGKYTPKDAYDAMEAGVNRFVMANGGRLFDPSRDDAEGAAATIASLQRIAALLPTQSKRTAEQDEFQQFSTIPALAYAANWVANVSSTDTMLEPSAGIGGLAAFARNAGAKLVLNELSSRRAEVLKEVFPGATIYREDAAQINNILPDDIKPSVVVMNPPFSSAAGRGIKDTMVGASHVDQALARLADGGRLVAVVGEGMAMDKSAFSDWWKKIKARYDVRAAVPMDGAGYAKYGTTFNNVLLVIDKQKPVEGRNIITTPVTDYTEIAGLLNEVRNGRPNAQIEANDRGESERDAAESALAGPDETGEGGGLGAEQPDHQDGAGLGNGTAGGRQPGVGAGGNQRGNSGRKGKSGGSVSDTGGKRTGNAQGKDAAAGGERDGVAGAGSNQTGQSGGVTIQSAEAASGKLTDSVFESYQPQRLQVPGAQPHPGPLVQSSAMASVLPPAPTYTPNLPEESIKEGKLSIAQIEAVVYAGQAHEQMLETGVSEKDAKDFNMKSQGAKYRRGFFIGDGTGVGKGREISGVILDNLRQGRKRHVWVTEKQGLLKDAQRDFSGVGGDPELIKAQSKVVKAGQHIPGDLDGILFTTYSTLRMGVADIKPASAKDLEAKFKGKTVTINYKSVDYPNLDINSINLRGKEMRVYNNNTGRYATVKFEDILAINGDPEWRMVRADAGGALSRVDQIVNWLGEDFDGVIAFDEAHNAGNAEPIKGERGAKEPSKQAIAVVELQKRLPNARVLYVSATGATEVANLSFASRLGLWGQGTAFSGSKDFVTQMNAGGLATMELVARDMKQMGAYMARSLSYDGVTYRRLEHELTPLQRDIYDRLSDAWQVTLKNMEAALQVVGAVSDDGKARGDGKNAKSAMKSAFWGAQQRFFNQIITSMQMPSVLDAIEIDLARGDAVVLQLVNTNEAAQERSLNKTDDNGETIELEELDLTPREQLMQMVEKAFPIQQYEEYVDDNDKRSTRIAKDSEGNPIINKEAVAMRDALLKDLENIRVPDGPLEQLINHFGPEKVAEITGRKRRVVTRPDKNGDVKARIESRGESAAKADAISFMDDKKQILVFSDAGGTGYSFHADKTKKNQRQRRHYLLQPGWRADKAVQGLGRSHRTNQASDPEFALVSTDVPAHKRFLSSIARRLDQLGALTKGQRDTSSNGLFSEKDNLESKYAQAAVRTLLDKSKAGEVPDLSFTDMVDQMGLGDIVNEDTGQIAESKYPDIRQFLNRMLSLKLDMQNKVFDAFSKFMEDGIRQAAERGELDMGMQTLRALESRIVHQETVYTDKNSGANTDYVEVELTHPARMYSFPSEKVEGAAIEWVVNTTSGKVWAKVKSGTVTDRYGNVEDRYRLLGTGGTQLKTGSELDKNPGAYRKITGDEARELWAKETAARPKTYTEMKHMIVGAMLPIWDRLKTDGIVQVARTQTVDGKRLLGRIIHKDDVQDIRKRLNVEAPESKLAPEAVIARVLRGEVGELANGWKLERSMVSGEARVELKAGYQSAQTIRNLEELGIMRERIQWNERFFIPLAKPEVLAALLKQKPLIGLAKPSENNGVQFSIPHNGVENNVRNPDATTTPLTEKEARLVRSRLARAIGKLARGSSGIAPEIEAVTDLDNRLRKLADFVEQRFGRGVIFYRSTDPRGHSGFYLPAQPDVIFVNAEGVDPVWQIAGHELLHAMRHGSPASYQIFATAVDKLVKNEPEFIAELTQAYRDIGRKIPSADAMREELIAEMAGRFFQDEKFWDHIKNYVPPTRMQSIWNWIKGAARSVLEKLGIAQPKPAPVEKSETPIEQLNRELQEKFLTDVEQARKAAAIAFRSFSENATVPLSSNAEIKLQNDDSGEPAPIFYSALRNLLATKGPERADKGAWLALLGSLHKQGVKPEEIEWSGIKDWLGLQSGKVAKADVLDYLRANGVQVEETMKGEIDEGDIEALLNNELGEGMTREDAIEYLQRDEQYEGSATKYSQYVLPGGENYRELLLTLPERQAPLNVESTAGWTVETTDENTYTGRREVIVRNASGQVMSQRSGFRGNDEEAIREAARNRGISEKSELERQANFKSGHWDEKNILAHVRFNERTDADGARVLFIEEIQSDWGQQGKKQGFGGAKISGFKYDEATNDWVRAPDSEATHFGDSAGHDDTLWGSRAEAERKLKSGVPTAPFVQKTDAWLSLAIKRMIRYAADNGFDKVAFINGEQSADRYDLSKQVESISADKIGDDQYRLTITQEGRSPYWAGDMKAEKLEEFVGKELASKIIEDGGGEYSGLDLKVGGEGMKTFYDQIVPKVAKEVLKKLGGGNIESVKVPTGDPSDMLGYEHETIGNEPSWAEIETVLDTTRRSGPNIYINPLNGKKMDFIINRVTPDGNLRRVKAAMESGKSFANAFAEHGDHQLAELFGVELRKVQSKTKETGQPGFAITPDLREKALGGMPLFSIPHSPSSVNGAPTVEGWKDVIRSPDMLKAFRQQVADQFQTQKTFNWWHRTLGTQYHKGKIDRDFGRVYEAAQSYLDDTSRLANEAADLAPGLLPKTAGLGDAVRQIGSMIADKKDAQAIAGPVFHGTLLEKSFTDEELQNPPEDLDGKPLFAPLTAKQIKLYRQYRAAIDKSLDDLAISEMARLAQTSELQPAPNGMSMREAVEFYREQYVAGLRLARNELATMTKEQAEELKLLDKAAKDKAGNATELKSYADQREAMKARHAAEIKPLQQAVANLEQLEQGIVGRADTIDRLKSQGYSPLMRFGQYTVDVVFEDENGNPEQTEDGEDHRPFFGMYESEAEANKVARAMEELYPGASIKQGVMSQEGFKMFRGITPETVEVFGKMMGADQDEAFQSYLKLAVNNRSAMKRLVHRLGIQGFNDDPTRVLATFITSNARAASGNYHLGELLRATAAIPQAKGDVKDEAVKLVQYLQNPADEGAWARSLLFANYLGGSVAAALVNMTQTFTTTIPYLHQFGGNTTSNVMAAMKAAVGRMGKNKTSTGDVDLDKALTRAEEEGIVAPHEIHMLQGESMRSGVLTGNRFTRNVMKAWGSFFSIAEQYNREVAFIAAYKVAQTKGMAGEKAYQFASDAVSETQFQYSKAARSNWARGPVGATLMTFKTFTINYLEFLKRLPPKERVLAMAVIFIAAGAQGLPFADDLDDLIDTIMQTLGFSWNTKQEKRAAIAKVLGEDAAGFIQYGVSYGLPIDLNSRLGMANLIPGTAVFKPSETNKTRDVVEFFGAAGGLLKQVFGSFEQLQSGNIGGALKGLAPKAISDIGKGVGMISDGYATDSSGRRTVDVSALDGLMKSIGFNPTTVAEDSRARSIVMDQAMLHKVVQGHIHDQWAQGIFEKDPEKIEAAKNLLREWNERNPESKIAPSNAAILRRVQQARLTADQRLINTTPKQMRAQLRPMLEGDYQ